MTDFNELVEQLKYGKVFSDKHVRRLQATVSKEGFVDEFLKYLQSSGEAPLDIINSKIKKFSFCSIPFLELSIHYRRTLTGDFGNTHTYTKQGQPKWDNEQQRYIAKEEIYHETEWYSDSFFVEDNRTHYLCLNDEFNTLLESSMGIEDLCKKTSVYFEKIDDTHSFCTQTEIIDLDYDNILARKKIQEFTKKDYEALDKRVNREFEDREFKRVYDCKKNIVTDTQSDANWVVILIPFGYIEYEYNGETYYFIKSIFQEQIDIKKTIPKDPEYNSSSGCLTEFLLFLIYSTSGYFCYKWSKLISLHHTKIILYLILIILSLDFIIMLIGSNANTSKNNEKRVKYIKSTFEPNEKHLKNMILHLEKPAFRKIL